MWSGAHRGGRHFGRTRPDAWQTFQVARWRIVKLKQDVKLTETRAFEIPPEIPPEVEAAARRMPMAPGDALEAEAASWHESQWGGRADVREAMYEEMDVLRPELEAQKAKVDALDPATPDATRVTEDAHLRGLQSGYDDAVKRCIALPEEVDAYKAGWDRGDWARAGLNERFRLRVESAQTLQRSANIRVKNTARELNLYRERGVTGAALAEAQECYKSALFDAETADQAYNEARASR